MPGLAPPALMSAWVAAGVGFMARLDANPAAVLHDRVIAPPLDPADVPTAISLLEGASLEGGFFPRPLGAVPSLLGALLSLLGAVLGALRGGFLGPPRPYHRRPRGLGALLLESGHPGPARRAEVVRPRLGHRPRPGLHRQRPLRATDRLLRHPRGQPPAASMFAPPLTQRDVQRSLDGYAHNLLRAAGPVTTDTSLGL